MIGFLISLELVGPYGIILECRIKRDHNIEKKKKMKRYFRVFDLTIFSSLVNFTSVYERINKCSDTIHKYGKSIKVQEIFHLRASVKKKQPLNNE